MTAPLRILLDGYNLALAEGTGVATYGRNLAGAIRAMGHSPEALFGRVAADGRDRLLREVTFFEARDRPRPAWRNWARNTGEAFRLPFGVAAEPVPEAGAVHRDGARPTLPALDRIWNANDLWGACHRHEYLWGRDLRVRVAAPPDLVHWTYPVPVRMQAVPNIFTVHDLVPLRLPHTTADGKRRFVGRLRRIVRDAAHIVTVSENSRRDILALLGIDPARVTNTYQSADLPPALLAMTQAEADGVVAGTFGLEAKNYFLFAGAIEPKKNVGRLIEAFLASGSTATLVLAGKAAWDSGRELRLLEEAHGLRSFAVEDGRIAEHRRVRRVAYTSQRLLVALLRGARALLFPSLYEGFGLPVVEAMQLGTPVITSNTGALAEIAADAALLVDPYDPRAMAAAIAAVDGDAALRDAYAARGRVRARAFSAERHQEKLRSVYQHVLGV